MIDESMLSELPSAYGLILNPDGTKIILPKTVIGNVVDETDGTRLSDILDSHKNAITQINNDLSDKLNATVVKSSNDYIILKIGSFYILSGYTNSSINAWEGINTFSDIRPNRTITNGAFQILSDGMVRVTSNVNAGTAYFLCWIR